MRWFHPLIPTTPRLCTAFEIAPPPGKGNPDRRLPRLMTSKKHQKRIERETWIAVGNVETLDPSRKEDSEG